MLQDALMQTLINEKLVGKKIQNDKGVSDKGQFVLDATEKNPNIENTLARQIADNSNSITRIKNSIDSIVALPDDVSTVADGEIAAAKVGPKGEKYSTLQDAISKQIDDYKGLKVSNKKPNDSSNVDVWVNTSLSETESSSYEVPQINDNEESTVDTWSSAKIKAMIDALQTTVEDGNGNTIILSELLDDLSYSKTRVWSSAKTRSEIIATLTNISDGNGGTINLLELIDDNADSTDRVWSAKRVKEAIEELIKNNDDSKIKEIEEKLKNLANSLSSVNRQVNEIDNRYDDLNRKVDNIKSIDLSDGEEGQFAVSDGNGGVKWITIANAEDIEF